MKDQIKDQLKAQVNINEVARYLGYKNGNLSAETLEDIKKCESNLETLVNLRTHHIVCNIEKGEEISVLGTTLKLSGKSIKNLLCDSDKCILMIATIGNGADHLISKLQITNMAEALITDFCASSLVESLADNFEAKLKSEILKEGEFFTDRFSPGYGDLPITIQKTFCEVLDSQRKVGVAVTTSGMMIPKKTITAIIGIANKPQKMKIKGCEFCDFKNNCEFKKGGKHCE
ncbi:MAG: vitamin B12 dependent-methionine synthase activation domain-containing protein [Bacillota bacterium]